MKKMFLFSVLTILLVSCSNDDYQPIDCDCWRVLNSVMISNSDGSYEYSGLVRVVGDCNEGIVKYFESDVPLEANDIICNN